jgi:thioredoxin-related protein
MQTKKEKPVHKIIILHFLIVLVSSYETKYLDSDLKAGYDGSSGDKKDEERESLRKLYHVFMVCSFHQMILRLSNQKK